MGGQLDKRMLHWQPATCCIFQLLIIICYLTNKVLGLLLLLRVQFSIFRDSYTVRFSLLYKFCRARGGDDKDIGKTS